MLVTAAVAGFFFVLFVIFCGITPAGDSTWSVFDMKMQYLDFYSYYKSVLEGKNDLFYSPAMTMGSGAVGFFSYYLSSPLLLILAFTDRLYLPEAVTVMNGLKLMFTAACADGMLRAHFLREGFDGKKLHTGIFALSYALCAYMMAYCVNPMWLEVFALAPLCLWMLERLLKEGKCAGYVICLGLAFWCNYYITYMLCIFIVFWTVICLVREPERWFKKLLRTGLCSLWGVALAAVSLIPTFLELFGSPKDVSLVGAGAQGQDLGIKEIFSKAWLLAFDPEQTFWGTPLLFAGSLIFLLTILYFLNRKIAWKDKLCAGILLVIFGISYALDQLNLLWHAGMEPSGYPYREVFLAVLFCCVCACRAYALLKEGTKVWHIAAAALLMLGLFAFTIDSAYPLKLVVLANVGTILCCALLLAAHILFKEKGPDLLRKALSCALALLQLLELFAGAAGIYGMQTSNGMLGAQEYRRIYSAMRETVDELPEDGFYRTENMKPREQNDGMMYDYNSLTHYSSAGLVGPRFYLQRLGFNDDGLYVAYGKDNTCTADSLLGVRYVISAENREGYKLIKDGEYSLHENPYALSTALVTEEIPWTDAEDPFSLQEEIYESLCGEELTIFVPLVSVKEKQGQDTLWECMAEKEGCVYLYLDGIEDEIQNLSVYVDEKFRSVYGNRSSLKVLNLGYYNAGEHFSLRVHAESGEETGRLLLVTEDMTALADAYKKASAREASVERLSSSHFRITIPEAADGMGLSTGIPFEDSWQISVDGKRVEARKIFDTFIYVPELSAGSVVELKYVPKGLIPGALISLAALALLIVFRLRSRKCGKEKTPETGN